jgi:hypothetical protein
MFKRKGPAHAAYGSDASRQRMRKKWWLAYGPCFARFNPGFRRRSIFVIAVRGYASDDCSPG